ncbi:MAG: alpha/beta fold hydrolase [Anaerolineaceae bacterium]
MIERTYETASGTIHYWISMIDVDALTLVFLPGLTADHRLYEKQIDHFKDKYNIIVWDAPGHAASWPFKFDFDLFDKAKWVNGILEQEKITKPVIIGQSMGGFVGQVFMELFPDKLKGFVAIDSTPLQRKYIKDRELWMLKRMRSTYYRFPWKFLVRVATNGVATSDYGRNLMREMMMVYEGDKERYADLTSHGFKLIAEGMESDLPYLIKCPALLICGEKDQVGYCLRLNKEWHEETGIPIVWVKDAGHNSNTDKPEVVNQALEDFIKGIA